MPFSLQSLLAVRAYETQTKCLFEVFSILWLFFFTHQQLHAIIAASVSIKSSQKLKKILEVSVLFSQRWLSFLWL